MTDANASGRRLGTLDAPLNDLGRGQALELAGRLPPLGVERIWTSPLARAKDTAAILADSLHLPLEVEPDLREMALGPWEGLTEEEIRARYPEEYGRWESDPSSLDLPGHEGIEATSTRVVNALERIFRTGERAVCVTHLAVIRLAWAHYEGLPRNRFVDLYADHCSLMLIERGGGVTEWRQVA